MQGQSDSTLETSIRRSADLSDVPFIDITIQAIFEGNSTPEDPDRVFVELSNDGGATFTSVGEMTPSISSIFTFDVDVAQFAVADVVFQMRIEPGRLLDGATFRVAGVMINGRCFGPGGGGS
jgi:hypothetical protein